MYWAQPLKGCARIIKKTNAIMGYKIENINVRDEVNFLTSCDLRLLKTGKVVAIKENHVRVEYEGIRKNVHVSRVVGVFKSVPDLRIPLKK